MRQIMTKSVIGFQDTAGGPILAMKMKNIFKTKTIFQEYSFYLRVKGNSMIDVGIYEEDLIGVNKSNITTKQIY